MNDECEPCPRLSPSLADGLYEPRRQVIAAAHSKNEEVPCHRWSALLGVMPPSTKLLEYLALSARDEASPDA